MTSIYSLIKDMGLPVDKDIFNARNDIFKAPNLGFNQANAAWVEALKKISVEDVLKAKEAAE